MTPTQRLHETIAAVCPIIGVSVGTPGVSASVRIDYAPEATGPQQTAAQNALAAFDWAQAAHDAWLNQYRAAEIGRVTAVRKSANQTRNAQTPADVADLVFQLLPDKHYIFEFEGAYTAAATTTGLRVGINGPVSPNLVRVVQEVHQTASTRLSSAVGAYDTPVLGNASAGATPMPFRVKGNISTGANGGTLSLRFASEVAGSDVTILSGSWGELKAVG